MRTRTTNGHPCPMIETVEYAWDMSVSPRVETWLYHPYQPTPVAWYIPNGFNSLVESIVDETGTDGAYRDCLHTVETNEFFAPIVKHRFPRGWGGNAYLLNLTAAQLVTEPFGLRVAPSIDMNAYADEALAFMLPRLNEGTSLVNFILELKDLKHMDPRGTYQRLFRRHTSLRMLKDKTGRRAFLRELTTRMNGAALNTSFGIVPFVADLVQIHDDLVSLASRLEGLKKYAGTRQQRHYKRVIPQSAGMFADREWHHKNSTTSWAVGLKSDNNDNGGIRRTILVQSRARWILRPVYHASMRYIYTLPEVDSQLEKVYALLDTLGVRIDPSIVWNAIPFSFVVDWIVDVSGFLGTFARDNYPINVQILDFCHSFKWHKEAEAYVQWTGDLSLGSPTPVGSGYPALPGWQQVYKGMRSSYSRVRHRPDIHTARIRGPRLRQAALSGALILSRTPSGSGKGYLNSAMRPLRRRITKYGVR